MKRRISGCILGAFAAVCGALLYGCNQEPLFWAIFKEYPPIESIIKGTPSRIVAAKTSTFGSDPVLYVSNYGGGLWEYDLNTIGSGGHPHWESMGGGNIRSVATISTLTGAASDELLFVLDGNGTVRNVTTGMPGTILPGLSGIKQIYGAGDYLFAGDGSDVFSINTSNVIVTLIPGQGMLMGAAEASGTYYLAAGTGVYSTTTPNTPITPASALIAGSEGTVMGIISDGTDVAAAYNDGVRSFSGGALGSTISYNGFSGAMTIWEDGGGNKRLLLGMMQKNSSFGYGYRETAWPVTAGISTPEPGIGITVTGSRFSAIGDHPVFGLYAIQIPGFSADARPGIPVIFASTVKSGLWSYRTRRGEPQWNGEDNSD